MGFVIGLLTFFMVLNCLLLIFLVLIQLPKKEAGAGLAFGGAATDALFGAGKGTVLTNVTKYSATIFFVLAVVLAILQRVYHTRNSSEFLQNLEKPGNPAGMIVPPPKTTTPAPAAPAVPAVPGAAATNFHLMVPSSNAPAAEPPAKSASPAANPGAAKAGAPKTPAEAPGK